MQKEIYLIICGLGNVGRAFLQLLAERGSMLTETTGLSFRVAAAVDMGGAAVAGEKGTLDLPGLLAHLDKGQAVETFQDGGIPGLSGLQALETTPANVLVETTPTNLVDGEPGNSHIRGALTAGMDVVSANKGPLVLYYRELHDLAAQNGSRLHLSAATAAALPTLDVARTCLAGATIRSAEGILNGTTNYILTRMGAEGLSFAAALAAAQELGIAETDPSYDVDGYDTANKTIIIANRIFGTGFGPADIRIEGIAGVTPEDIAAATGRGEVIKLLGRAEKTEAGITLEVVPRSLPASHPLAAVNGSEKAISYLTDTMDRVTVSGGKSSPVGAAAALLKDLINAFR